MWSLPRVKKQNCKDWIKKQFKHREKAKKLKKDILERLQTDNRYEQLLKETQWQDWQKEKNHL